MLTPQQEELKIIEDMISNANYCLIRGIDAGYTSSIVGWKELNYLQAIATSLLAIAKLLQLQAENS